MMVGGGYGREGGGGNRAGRSEGNEEGVEKEADREEVRENEGWDQEERGEISEEGRKGKERKGSYESKLGKRE